MNEMRNTIQRNLFAIMVLSMMSLSAGPVLGERWTVEAEGMARVEPDITISRDLAILRAKQQALEMLGIGINSKNITVQGKLLDEIIMVQTKGLVDVYEILEEREQDGYYHVRLRVLLKRGEHLEEAFNSIFRERTLAISCQGPGSEVIEREIRKRLSERFYYVLGKGDEKPVSDYTIRIDSGVDPYSDLGFFRSFYVTVGISLVQTSTGKEVLHVSTDKPELIYGINLDQALNGRTVNQFPTKVAEPLAAIFWKKLNEFESKDSRIITIRISGLPDLKAFCEFRDYVKSIRLGMEGVLKESYQDGQGILEVGYREKSFYLAILIGHRTAYRIIDQDWDRIQVVYSGNRT